MSESKALRALQIKELEEMEEIHTDQIEAMAVQIEELESEIEIYDSLLIKVTYIGDISRSMRANKVHSRITKEQENAQNTPKTNS